MRLLRCLGREGHSDFSWFEQPQCFGGWAGMHTLSLCWFLCCFPVFLGLWVCRSKTTEGNCPSHHILPGLFSQHDSSCALGHLTEECLVGVTTEEFFLPLSILFSPERGPTLVAHTYGGFGLPPRGQSIICTFRVFHRFVSSPHFCIYSAIFLSVWTMDTYVYTACFHLRASLLFILLLKLFQPQAWELLCFVSF